MRRFLLINIVLFALVLLAVPQAMALGTPAGTVIENQAFADYNDANGNPMDQVASEIITTLVNQVAGVLVEPETGTKNGVPGSEVYYAVTVHNTGNGTDTFDLSVVNVASPITPVWPTTIYLDSNGDGIWDPLTERTVITDTGELDADEFISVIVVTTVPLTASGGDSSLSTLTAISQLDNGVTDSGAYTTTVETAVLEITKAVSPSDPQPDDILTYAITGKNLGSTTAFNVSVLDDIPANTTYVSESMRLGPIGGTYGTATVLTDANDVEPTAPAPVTAFYNSGAAPERLELFWGDEDPFLGAGVGGVFYFQVKVNASVTEGTVVENSATASFEVIEDSGTFFDSTSNEASSTVALAPEVSIDEGALTANGDPSDVITYEMDVCNDGNNTETIDITYSTTAGWSWAFWLDANEDGIAGNDGDFLLTDTDGNGIIDTGSLAQETCAPILAVATIPAGTSDQTTDTLIVTATARDDDGNIIATDTSDDFVTTVTAPNLTIIKEVSPTGPQDPDTELTYTVTVTNEGTGVATAVTISDSVPDFTTYVPESILTGPSGGPLVYRDDSPGNGGEYDSVSGTVIGGGLTNTLGQGGTFVLQFRVTID